MITQKFNFHDFHSFSHQTSHDSTRSSNLKPFQKVGQERMFAKWQWVIASEKQPSARFCPMRIWDAHNTYRARMYVSVCVYTRCGFVCVGGDRRNGDQDPILSTYTHPPMVFARCPFCGLTCTCTSGCDEEENLLPKKLLANAVPRTTRESFFRKCDERSDQTCFLLLLLLFLLLFFFFLGLFSRNFDANCRRSFLEFLVIFGI